MSYTKPWRLIALFSPLILLLGFVASLNSHVGLNVSAQSDCRSDPNFFRLDSTVAVCDYETFPSGDNEGEEKYEGYFDYKKCISDTCQPLLDEGGTKRQYINCAQNCERTAGFDRNYIGCTTGAIKEAGKSLALCLCNNDANWLKDYPSTCDKVIPKTVVQNTTDFLAGFLPACSLSVSQSAEGLVNCLKSTVNVAFLFGIAILFSRIAYIGIASAMAYGKNFWVEAKKGIEGLIIGIVFLGMPTVIMNLISPSALVISLAPLSELNLGVNLVDPFSLKKSAICDDDPESSGGEIIYDLLLESEDDIKFPNIAFFDCELHLTASGVDSHKHWYLPIFSPNDIVETQPFRRRSNMRVDYVHPRVAANADSLAIAVAEDDGLYTRLWREDETWGPETKVWSGERAIFGSIIPTGTAWAGVAVDDYSHFYAGPISADAASAGNFQRFSPDVDDTRSYGRRYSLATNPDFSTTMFASSGGSPLYLYTYDGQTFSDSQTISIPNGDGCYYPDLDIDENGKIYVACYVPGGPIYVFEGSGSGWTSEALGTGAATPSIAIDEEGGVHMIFIGGSANTINYYYKPDGGSWGDPVEIPTFMGFNISAVAHHGASPYVAFTFEDWTSGRPQTHLYLVAANQ